MIYIADQQPLGTPFQIPTLHASVALAHLYHARRSCTSHTPLPWHVGKSCTKFGLLLPSSIAWKMDRQMQKGIHNIHIFFLFFIKCGDKNVCLGQPYPTEFSW